MITRTEFPYQVEEIEHCWIPMSDGTRLAARIWLPEGAREKPVPAVLEFIPYRKRDFTAPRDARNHPYFAGHGYAGVRVDMRGSGESEGILEDEYLEQEQEDGREILRWIAAQNWCDGSVGMFGISWGGFNGLQIAARQPPELKAIITVASTDDRYADDVHYMGGCLLGDNLSWASTMFAYNSSPPDPQLVGDSWRDMWEDRMENSGLWVVNWLQHQRRDWYWQHGSVCEDIEAITCPVMAVSGWADGYSNAVFRLIRDLRAPRLGLIGPWSHKYPHMGVPGPAIGFLQECIRWWDRWLKGEPRGYQSGPVLCAWMQEYAAPSTFYKERVGRWVTEDQWPSPHIFSRRFQLDRAGGLVLDGVPSTEEPLWVNSPLSVGQFAGKWCSYAATPDLPGDQREEDGGSLVWETEPLDDRLEILGKPWLRLRVAANQPVAQVAVRLSDVDRDGRATRVSYGVLNLTHRNGHENPEPLEPGKFYEVAVAMNDCAHAFPRGHRIRLSLSSSIWPLVWPAPRPARVSVDTGKSDFTLPCRPPRSFEDGNVSIFGPPEAAPELAVTTLRDHEGWWKLERDLGTAASTLHVMKDDGRWRLEEIDLTVENRADEYYRFADSRYDSVEGETVWKRRWQRADWDLRTRTRTVMTSSPDHFHITAELDGYIDDIRVFSKNWDESIPRDHV